MPHEKPQLDKETASENEEVLASFVVDGQGHLNRCIDLSSLSPSRVLSDVMNFRNNGVCEIQAGNTILKHIIL